VTGVCGGAGAGLVRDLGASAVIDYAQADFTGAGQVYDVIFDVAGKSSFARCRGVLADPGIYLTTAPGPAIFAQMPWTARFGSKRAVVAVIGACYPLERIADAYRHVDAGHKKGNVIVTMAGPA
jgi:NADPH:quinone reductase-like Zn-dependent oxidoreductase